MSSKSPLLEAVAQATERFAARAAGGALHRIEVKVASRNGMPLLCAVEAALRDGVPGAAPRELVWLGGGACGGSHRLQLRAFAVGGGLIAEAVHAFEDRE
jgi:hypothetical protein